MKEKHNDFQILKKGAVFTKDLDVKNWNLTVKLYVLITKIISSVISDIDRSTDKIISFDYDEAYDEYLKT